MAKRRIMRAFKLNEISAVDFPAQTGARMVLMKRAENEVEAGLPVIRTKDDLEAVLKNISVWGDSPEAMCHIESRAEDILGSQEAMKRLNKADFTAEQRDRLANSGIAMPDGSFPIRNEADLKNAISSFGRANNKAAVARHIERRAKALGETDLLPTSGELASLLGRKNMEKDHKMSKDLNPEEIVKALEDANIKIDELTEKVDSAEKSVTAKETELKVAKRLGDMTDAQKAFYQELGTEEAVAFLAKSNKDMDEDIAKAQEKDKVIYKAEDGTEYRKSDDPRLVEMAKRDDAREKELAEVRKANEDAAYAKRAEEYKHLPGTVEETVAILKAVDKIEDTDVREAALKNLKASNEEMAKAFEEHGTAANEVSKTAEEEISKRVKEIAKDKGISEEKAQIEFLRTPEGDHLYAQTTQH